MAIFIEKHEAMSTWGRWGRDVVDDNASICFGPSLLLGVSHAKDLAFHQQGTYRDAREDWRGPRGTACMKWGMYAKQGL
jgi:hypothetical protein